MFNIKLNTIRARVIAIVMLVSSVTAIVMLSGGLLISYSTNQALLEDKVKNLTQVIANNARATASFNDSIESQRLLDTLNAVPNVVFAELKNNTGSLLAVYRRSYEPANNLPSVFKDTFYERVDIYQDEIFVGHLKIVSDGSALAPAMKKFLILSAILLLLALITAYLFASGLQARISQPIEELSTSMQRLANSSGRSLHIESYRDDELGMLLQSFNDMVLALNEREKLLEHKAELLRMQISQQDLQLSQEESKRLDWLQNVARFLQHELKNTLLGFTSSLDMLERKLEQPELIKYIERARKSSLFMSKLLHNIGSTTSIEAAILDEKPEPLFINETVESWVDNYRMMTGDTAIELSVIGHGYIKANGYRIEQLLEKLVNNAETYSLENTSIDIKLVTLSDEVLLSVANQGTPLPEDKSTMFNLFVSQREESDSGEQHFGLGLYIVKIISEAYSGYVEAKDMDGKEGAVFEVHFPRHRLDLLD